MISHSADPTEEAEAKKISDNKIKEKDFKEDDALAVVPELKINQV